LCVPLKFLDKNIVSFPHCSNSCYMLRPSRLPLNKFWNV
jgi:hypothetical protein